MSYNLHYAKSMKNGDTLGEDAAAGYTAVVGQDTFAGRTSALPVILSDIAKVRLFPHFSDRDFPIC